MEKIRIRDQERKKFGSGVRYKHPGSATPEGIYDTFCGPKIDYLHASPPSGWDCMQMQDSVLYTLIKKKIKFSSKEIQNGAVAKSSVTNSLPHIWLRFAHFLTRVSPSPYVTVHPIPCIWISLYMRKISFSFLSVYVYAYVLTFDLEDDPPVYCTVYSTVIQYVWAYLQYLHLTWRMTRLCTLQYSVYVCAYVLTFDL